MDVAIPLYRMNPVCTDTSDVLTTSGITSMLTFGCLMSSRSTPASAIVPQPYLATGSDVFTVLQPSHTATL